MTISTRLSAPTITEYARYMAMEDIRVNPLSDEIIEKYLRDHSRFSATFVDDFAAVAYEKRQFESPLCSKTVLILAASSPADYFAQKINAKPASLATVMKHAYVHGVRKIFSYLQMHLINNESA